MPRTAPRPAHAVPCARSTPTPTTTSTAQLIDTLEPRMLLSAVYGYTEARTVDDFVDSIGINIKLDRGVYKNNNNFQNRVLPALTDLEIRHYRDRLINLDNTTFANRYAEILDDTGARMLGLSVPYEEPNPSPTKDKNRAKNAPAGVIEAINGPNEPDVFNHPDYKGFTNTSTDFAASQAYQDDLFAAVNSDAATADLPVLSPSMAFSRNVKYIAPADYDIIAGNRYTSFYTTNFELNKWFNETADWNTDKPIWITEAGHVTTPDLSTPNSVSERAQGIYMPRLLTEYFRSGVERTYIHQLLDEGTTPNDDNDHWGLIRADGSFKPAYHALDNLIDLLNEANFNDTTDQWDAPSFTPDPLDYEFLPSPGANARTPLVLQNSDDTYFLLTFRAENAFSGFDPNNKFDTNFGDANVTLNFAQDIESVTHHRYDGTGALNTYAITQNGDNQLVVPLSEEMSLIELKLESPAFQQDPGSNGFVSIQAENFDINTPSNTHAWTQKSGGSGNAHLEAGPDIGANRNSNYTNSSPELEYRVNFTQTGTHYVWVRGKAGGFSTNNSDSLHVGLNGNAVASADRITGFGSTFGWRSVTMDNNSRPTLNITSTGVQTLNVWMREDGFDFDKIVLTTNPNFTPTGNGPADSPQIIASAPILQHHFTFEGTNDDVVGGVQASFRNGAGLTSNSKIGSQALALDGNNDHVITNDPLAEGDQFTIAAWVYIPPNEPNIQGILSNMNGTGSGYLFNVNSFNSTDRRLVFETRNSSGTVNKATTNANAVTFGQWNHLAAVVDRTTGSAQLYVNGINQTADSTIHSDFKVNSTGKIGSKGDGGFTLEGRIDDLRIYDGLLSTAELAALASA